MAITKFDLSAYRCTSDGTISESGTYIKIVYNCDSNSGNITSVKAKHVSAKRGSSWSIEYRLPSSVNMPTPTVTGSVTGATVQNIDTFINSIYSKVSYSNFSYTYLPTARTFTGTGIAYSVSIYNFLETTGISVSVSSSSMATGTLKYTSVTASYAKNIDVTRILPDTISTKYSEIVEVTVTDAGGNTETKTVKIAGKYWPLLFTENADGVSLLGETPEENALVLPSGTRIKIGTNYYPHSEMYEKRVFNKRIGNYGIAINNVSSSSTLTDVRFRTDYSYGIDAAKEKVYRDFAECLNSDKYSVIEPGSYTLKCTSENSTTGGTWVGPQESEDPKTQTLVNWGFKWTGTAAVDDIITIAITNNTPAFSFISTNPTYKDYPYEGTIQTGVSSNLNDTVPEVYFEEYFSKLGILFDKCWTNNNNIIVYANKDPGIPINIPMIILRKPGET